jgi:two-component system cell cycle response regulator
MPQIPSSSRIPLYATVGALLGLGAPAGWLLLRTTADVSQGAILYGYLGVGTVIAFAAFGALLARQADRLAEVARQLEHLAASDPLTGLPNRRYFVERLDAECARARRRAGALALISIDLDYFKRVNDRHGHPFGDRMLQHVAGVLRSAARVEDVVCRVGGEEFFVLCPGADAEDARAIAERFRAALAGGGVLDADGTLVRITASAGIAVHRPNGSAEDLILRADRALYEAKGAGRNRVELGLAA